MAIPCPRCGRHYDVTLFPFGRTIHCTCGERVGRQTRVPLVPESGREPPRFVADAMLGRLARWLRILGYDTWYDSRATDESLVRRAAREGRALLTRDRRIPLEWRVAGCLVIRSDDTFEQLREVVHSFDLVLKRNGDTLLFTRCPCCNTPLRHAPGDRVREVVPAGVRAVTKSFSLCPTCGKVYWEGSHTRRIRRRLEELFRAAG